ncbi:GGDEF domain-containing protein [Oryzifoliimicrobium ureilyticus]|uniref:GGDEF domain-containing protein n=1 Tax=Oryzifoliimicrobium ureilyticus TaxID=3113724 RepID=UPI0030763555
MAAGLLRLSSRQPKQADWLLIMAALAISAVVGCTRWYADNSTRAAIFNATAAGFLTVSGVGIARDFFTEGLTGRLGIIASISAAAAFSALVTVEMVFPAFSLIEARSAFFLLIICHFSLALFVLVLVHERAEALLLTLANTDALTGIPNRQRFLSHLPTVLRKGDTYVMIDIDHFKSVNDRHGHETGDAVLIGVAQTIAAVAGKEVALGRLGGEEFGLFLGGQTEATAYTKADEIRRAIKKLAFTVAGDTISTSVSVGVALWDGVGALKELRAQADQALYLSKAQGRDRVELYASEQKELRSIGEKT